MPSGDLYGLLGQILDGQFRVDRAVGEGGFSIVYRGHHLGLDEPVAIKCLKLQPQLGSAIVENFVRRFRDESRIHYKLSKSSLSIARTIGAGTTMSPATGALIPYMVLEWLDGFSLAEELRARRLRGERGRSLREVIRFLDPIAEAMATAHALGVVHRDLNPSNLFLAMQPEGGRRLKIMDFGVAKILSDGLALGPRAITLAQLRVFTPTYGAPEQFDERYGAVGTWTDVYAFALLVVELLTDRTPNEGEHLGELMERACSPDERPTPANFGVDVGEAAEALLGQALAIAPLERPRDVGEFWGTLKNAVQRDSESFRPRPPPSPPPPSPAAFPLVSPLPPASRHGTTSSTPPTERSERNSIDPFARTQAGQSLSPLRGPPSPLPPVAYPRQSSSPLPSSVAPLVSVVPPDYVAVAATDTPRPSTSASAGTKHRSQSGAWLWVMLGASIVLTILWRFWLARR